MNICHLRRQLEDNQSTSLYLLGYNARDVSQQQARTNNLRVCILSVTYYDYMSATLFQITSDTQSTK